jgi:hypothetical protein
MKLFKALLLTTLLFLTPALALAGDFIEDDVIGDDFGDSTQPIPEPSGALVMGVALATASLALRRRK